jgi:hypothetical protein
MELFESTDQLKPIFKQTYQETNKSKSLLKDQIKHVKATKKVREVLRRMIQVQTHSLIVIREQEGPLLTRMRMS